jgi:hypothetical protein
MITHRLAGARIYLGADPTEMQEGIDNPSMLVHELLVDC